MEMYPEFFFEAFVENNLYDFRESPGDARKGINAAVSAFHMADNYFNFHWRRSGKALKGTQFRKAKIRFLKQRSRDCEYFRDIQSITNVYKHLYEVKAKAHVTVLSGGALIVSAGDNQTLIESPYGSQEKATSIFYQVKTGEKKALLPAVTAVVEMWRKMIFAANSD